MALQAAGGIGGRQLLALGAWGGGLSVRVRVAVVVSAVSSRSSSPVSRAAAITSSGPARDPEVRKALTRALNLQ
ncbi:hypothetical protein, partial [Nonomuraea sp. NPDC003201]